MRRSCRLGRTETALRSLGNLELTIDGEAVALELRSAAARLRPGQGGLATLRSEAVFAAEIADRGQARLPRRERPRTDRLARDHRGRRGRRRARWIHRAVLERERRSPVVPAGPAVQPARRDVDGGAFRAGRERPLLRGPIAQLRPPRRAARGRGRTVRRLGREPRFGARDARASGRRRVRSLARAAARPRQDADGGVHGGIRRSGPAGGGRRFGGCRHAHGLGPGPRDARAHARAHVPAGDAVPVAWAQLRPDRTGARSSPADRTTVVLVSGTAERGSGAGPPRPRARSRPRAHAHRPRGTTTIRRRPVRSPAGGSPRSRWPAGCSRRRAHCW